MKIARESPRYPFTMAAIRALRYPTSSALEGLPSPVAPRPSFQCLFSDAFGVYDDKAFARAKRRQARVNPHRFII